LTVLDPYILSLQYNYYYPIAQDFSIMAEDEDITDLIKEIDSDEPPTQSEDPQQTSDPKEKLASYCH
jgi:hypothetical protein